MNDALNHTHDPSARSWVTSANRDGADFPIQNLPFGVFRAGEPSAPARVGVAIGEAILDVAACGADGMFTGHAAEAAAACAMPALNLLMAQGPAHWSALRHAIFDLLRQDHPAAGGHESRLSARLLPAASVTMVVPASVGDYTDFYASIFHATNVGRMMRPDNPLLPNYKYLPIGYHGRASSIVASGTPVRRPWGQVKADGSDAPRQLPTGRLDYELEVGVFVGVGNDLGQPLSLADVERHLFGLCLVNDWSARDIQAWEYQPLGPFLAKSFATTVSPWVVTMEALAPFRVAPFARPADDPAPLAYLDGAAHRQRGGIDLHLEVWLRTARMRETGVPAVRLSRSNLRDMYWTVGQMAAHHTSNGCNLRPGDLLASGTVSGPAEDGPGCLLELAWRGTRPVTLPTGETRAFLEDGDEVVFKGRCQREGVVTIGFGGCAGVVTPAHPPA